MTLDSAKILVVSRTETDSEYLKDFFGHLKEVPEPDFVVNKMVTADKYHFIIFDARTLPPLYKIADEIDLPDDIRNYYSLLDRYISDSTKYIVFFGKFYYKLNQERCPSANSKFTLFARIRELIDFLNHYE